MFEIDDDGNEKKIDLTEFMLTDEQMAELEAGAKAFKGSANTSLKQRNEQRAAARTREAFMQQAAAHNKKKTAEIIPLEAGIDLDALQDCQASDDLTPEKSVRFLHNRLYARGYVTVIAGEGGSSKTTFSMTTAIAMATGTPIFGLPVDKCRVCFLGIEDDQDANLRVLNAGLQEHGVSLEGTALAVIGKDRLHRILKVPKTRPVNLLVWDDDTKSYIPNDVMVAKFRLLFQQFDAVIIDPLAVLYGGMAITNEVMNIMARTLDELAQETDIALAEISHVRKPTTYGNRPASQHDIKHGSELVDVARVVVNVTEPNANTTKKWKERDPDLEGVAIRSATITKSNITATGLLMYYRINTQIVVAKDGGESEVQAVSLFEPPTKEDAEEREYENDFIIRLVEVLNEQFVFGASNAQGLKLWNVITRLYSEDGKKLTDTQAKDIQNRLIADEVVMIVLDEDPDRPRNKAVKRVKPGPSLSDAFRPVKST